MRILSKADSLELLGYLLANINDDSKQRSLALFSAILDEIHGDLESAKTKFTELYRTIEDKDYLGRMDRGIISAMERLGIPEPLPPD